MTSPRIVVGMGVYNEEQYLDETIPAALNQTMSDFHLFILDNGSTDGSWEILKRFSNDDARITLIRSPRNMRCPESTNFGYGICMTLWHDCPWFVGAGADDIMDSDYLAAILAAAERDPAINLIFSPMRFIGQPERAAWRYPAYVPKRVHEQLMVPGWRAFTRELWELTGPEYTGLDGGSDWEWICRASVKGVLRPFQLPRSYVSLRTRKDRPSQSDLADRTALHTRMRELQAAR